ncbi:MAG: beta-ketoacyl-ACP synthase II [Actinomycetales bacterium]|nr:beta-ketoacyl-ACP synthase II [Actinomycetales bacterium]
MTPQVVITGMGATTPVGGDVPTSWANVLAGRPGIRVIEEDWTHDQASKIAGIMAVDPGDVLDRVQARKMDRCEQAAVVAAREAWAHAGAPEVDPLRLGAVVGTGIGGIRSLMEAQDTLREKGASRISPHLVTMIMPNGPAAMVGLEIGARAGVHAPVSACASGAEAISYAARMIQSGRADVVIAGGTEACIHAVPMAGFASMRALSTRNDDPLGASRPYDIDRDGFVMGEGAGLLVLESAAFAAARGATVYGVYAGSGLSADGHHIAQPDPHGLGAARAMVAALADAGASPADVVHVNAHATSTPQGDIAEAVAIRAALGDDADAAVVTGTKSMTGHLLGGAGAVESIFTILALRDRLVPPTANLVSLDPEVHLDVAAGSPRPLPAGDLLAINNSFGFGGHDVALVFRSA